MLSNLWIVHLHPRWTGLRRPLEKIKRNLLIWKKEISNTRKLRKKFRALGENRTHDPPSSSSDAQTTELLCRDIFIPGSQGVSVNGWSPGRVMNRFSTIECNWQTFAFLWQRRNWIIPSNSSTQNCKQDYIRWLCPPHDGCTEYWPQN